MHFDFTINLWYIGMTVFLAGAFYQRIGAIEKKLDTFISKEVVDEKQKAADHEHAAIRREVNGVTRRVEALEDRG